MPEKPATLSAAEAAAYLGVTPATLYSYVSRGLVQSEAVAGTRARRYRVTDLERLRRKREQRGNPAVVAAAALDFGEPVLASSLSLIQEGELYYRGVAATELADRASFEEVAALLWTGARAPVAPAPLPALWQTRLATLPAPAHPVDRLLSLLTVLHAEDPAARETGPAAVMSIGRHAMQALVVLAGAADASVPLAESLARLWNTSPRYAKLLDGALVLLADHELNVSSFTARCVASTDASAYLALAAAMAALQGPRHGGAGLQCEAFLREVHWDGAAAVTHRLRRGDPIPGFGHPLYPAGDPRARYLLARLLAAAADTPQAATVRTAADAAAQALGRAPNVDFALAALAHVLGLPTGASLVIFCLGRLAGWVAHILEQQQTGQLIRPRARYIGPPPQQPGGRE